MSVMMKEWIVASVHSFCVATEVVASLSGHAPTGESAVYANLAGGAIINEAMSNEAMINEQIRDREVRLIGADGEQIGIVSGKEAQKLASEANLDLVKIAPQAKPPVCKIMDYGKFKFDATKKEKEARKKQKTITVKEIRLSASIQVNDLNTKLRNAQKFLSAGDKVKISVVFRGREMMHKERGVELLEQAVEQLKEFGEVDAKPKLEGRSMGVLVSPK